MAREKSEEDWLEPTEPPEYEGQLAIDVYQNEEAVMIIAPIAGVADKDIEISITDEVVTIRGQRHRPEAVTDENYFTQECYWGAFARSYLLPVAVEAEGASASLSNGILKVVIPKQEKAKTKVIKVTSNQ